GSAKIDILGGDDPLKKNILKLKAKRIDVLIEAKAVFDHTVKAMGMADLFRPAGSDGEADPVYIAFSPKHPKSKEYAKMLSDGIEELRQSGELAKILAKYGQADWK
ncbi:MAG: amino acid ABC transporter substrate-binding protein, partial [Desulfobacteraceae bacterium]|nr:amino acid ABC transporter substrate-binding protein [Desulfobacteraceae bacterium]